MAFTRTDKRASADGTGYYLWRCECGAKVNGAGLSLSSHARSNKHAAAGSSVRTEVDPNAG